MSLIVLVGLGWLGINVLTFALALVAMVRRQRRFKVRVESMLGAAEEHANSTAVGTTAPAMVGPRR